jgi:hypothetical protein
MAGCLGCDLLAGRRARPAVAAARARPSAGRDDGWRLTPELPDSSFDPVLIMLTRLAARRHGQAALLRALARAERAPAAINAI